MKAIKVRIDFDHGKWSKEQPSPIVEDRAADAGEGRVADAHDAAELASGVPPQTEDRPYQEGEGRDREDRAPLSPLDGLRRAHEIAHLYAVGSFKIAFTMAAIGAISMSWATRAAFSSARASTSARPVGPDKDS
jgi:hypothetical protein